MHSAKINPGREHDTMPRWNIARRTHYGRHRHASRWLLVSLMMRATPAGFLIVVAILAAVGMLS